MTQILSRFPRFSLKFIVTVMLLQGLYWFVLAPFLFAAPKISPMEVTNERYAEISAPSFDVANAVKHQNTEFPIYACCEPVHLSIKMDVVLDEIPADGLGFIKTFSISNYSLMMNDTLILSEGRMDLDDHTFHGQQTHLQYMPASILKRGVNTVHIITVRSGNPYSDIFRPIIAPYKELRQQSAQRLWIMNEYQLVVITILLLVAIFGLFLLTHSGHKTFSAWLVILSATWAASSIFAILPVWPISSLSRLVVYHGIHFTLPVALFCLIDSWTDRPVIWAQFGLIAIAIVCFGVSWVSLVFSSSPQGYDLSNSLSHWMSFGVGVLILLRMGFHVLSNNDGRQIELAVLSLPVVALGVDAWTEITTQAPRANLDQAAPILMVGLTLAFLSRNFHLFRSSTQMNTVLSQKLSERQEALDAALEAKRSLIQARAHQEERQRIASDMHDGLGSELMALLIATKRGRVDSEWVSEGLQSVIDEMRLMMDSMDSVGESFGSALAVFRDRLTPRVERAGLELEWKGKFETLPELEGRNIIHVFRILQEAVTNSIKHSGGSKITIEVLSTSSETQEISLHVHDDGNGLPANYSAGRGLQSMSARAKNLGGKIETLSSESGFTIKLRIPLKMSEDSDCE